MRASSGKTPRASYSGSVPLHSNIELWGRGGESIDERAAASGRLYLKHRTRKCMCRGRSQAFPHLNARATAAPCVFLQLLCPPGSSLAGAVHARWKVCARACVHDAHVHPARTCAHTCTLVREGRGVRSRLRARARVHALHARARVRACVRACARACAFMCIRARMRAPANSDLVEN